MANKRKQNILIVGIVVVILFCVLYGQMIFGDKVFVYSDIGCDTINQYYPYYEFFLNNTSLDGEYSFQNGLGSYTDGLVYQWITNPAKIIYSLFGHGRLNAAVLTIGFFCFLVSAIVSYLLFEKKVRNKYAAICGAFLWAFSGFILLWGQHYSWAISYTFITIFLYLLLQCEFGRWKDLWGLGVCLFFFFCYSYYFVYMMGIFSVIYIWTKCLLGKIDFRESVRRTFMLGCVAAVSGGLAMFKLWPSLAAFLGSSRSGSLDVTQDAAIIYNIQYLLTDLSRFFSTNILGIGNAYSGAYNYYEGAVLFVSGLAPYAIVYFLLKRGDAPYWKKMILILVAIGCLICPMITKLLTFNANKQRWTFILVFWSVFCIVRMLDDILEGDDARQMRITSIVGVTFSGLCLGVIALANYFGFVIVDKKVFFTTVLVLVIYMLFLFLGSYKTGKWWKVLFIIFLSVEIIVSEYGTVNRDGIISKQDFANAYYNDGTEDIVENINEDKNLYRISKTYISVFLNDALVQKYNGMAEYTATMSESVANYMVSNEIPFFAEGEYSRASKYVNVPWNDYFITTLLGEKYLISDGQQVIGDDYEFVLEENGKCLYKNKNNLNFGYLYEKEILKEAYNELSPEEKRYCLTGAFYQTEESQTNIVNDVVQRNELVLTYDQAKQNLENLKENQVVYVTYEKNVYSGRINNPYENAMLCVPIFYNNNWKALIDGEQVATININGGLVGIELEKGEHEIILKYSNDEAFIGTLISGTTAVILLIVWMVRKHSKKFQIQQQNARKISRKDVHIKNFKF